MQRISTATRVVDKFGAGKDGFTDGDVVGGIPATDLEADLFDNVQEEIANVVEGEGIVLDGAVHTQLRQAIIQMIGAAPGLVPIGGVIDCFDASTPAGFLVCPVSATNISRTTYSALFAKIGTIFGAGDGATTFGMPWFPADYASVQANGNEGTQTVGANLAHTHTDGLVGLAGNNGGTGPGTAEIPTAGSTGSSGGSANLPAGVRAKKIIRYI